MENEAAFARFVEEQHAPLVRTLTLYTGDAQLAADLAADALAKAAQHWSQLSTMASPGGWVHRVGINAANSWFRRRAAARRALARRGPDRDMHHDPDGADVVAVRDAIGQLPRRRRACVVLHHLADLDTDEVAAALEIAPATVRSHLRHAYADLRSSLGDAIVPDRPREPDKIPPMVGHADPTPEHRERTLP